MLQLKRGVLIAIEGIDGSGKSTLAKNLSRSFTTKQLPTMLTKEPGGTPLGQQLRAIVEESMVSLQPKAEYLLFAADRAQHFSEVIIPQLQKNMLIISDRLADSSSAYQGYGRGLNLTMIQTINAWVMQNRQPDLVIYIKIPVTIALERVKKRKKLTSFEQEKLSFTQRVAGGFDTLYKDKKNVIIIDGMQSSSIITKQAIQAIETWINQQQLIKDSS
ncbi:MAG TPA: dTMP kinase [Candidatus Dependentiae bacterium]|nr:dTMP kinase [Candidatus Dependentiae bacterium]